MLLECLWPTECNLKAIGLQIIEDSLLVEIESTQQGGKCPACQTWSQRLNGHYIRRPQDLPCVGYRVQLQLSIPRFFCDNVACRRRTFAGQFPGFVRRYGRREREERVLVFGQTNHSFGIFGSVFILKTQQVFGSRLPVGRSHNLCRCDFARGWSRLGNLSRTLAIL